MIWSELTFGRHEGRILPEVVFRDPDWFFWAMENDVFERRGVIKHEADYVCMKATSIRIPRSNERELEVQHYIHPGTGKFGQLEVVPKEQPLHSQAFRGSVIDLSVARSIARYDKCGSRLLVRCAKEILFGSKSYRMTRQRCEEFFDDESNFE